MFKSYDTKQNAILRQQYCNVLEASSEKIYSGVRRSREATQPNTRIYFHPTSCKYNVVLLTQNQILVYLIRSYAFRLYFIYTEITAGRNLQEHIYAGLI